MLGKFFKKSAKGGSVGEKDILKALSNVIDPDLHRDIVSLGFIKNLKISGEKVAFDVELTTPACPVKDLLKEQCYEEVRKLGVSDIEITMTAQVRKTPTNKKEIPGVRNIIAVASGKGGVGKSTVCINLALAAAARGARVGVLDCDFYGPSLPSLVGLHERVEADKDERLMPHRVFGIQTMSMGYLVDRTQAVVWRGPMLHKMLQQFLYGVNWGELDYLFLDLPPGTGDVQLSLTQSTPISGAVLVTTPQEVALRDVEKGIEMFQTVKIPILGVIENMSYYLCQNCQKKHYLFRKEGGLKVASEYGKPVLGEIPLNPVIHSELGKGEPVMFRVKEGPIYEAFIHAAGLTVAEVSKLGMNWAEPGANAMEV